MQKPIFLDELITEIKQGNSLSKLKLQAWFTRYVEERQEYNITYEINKEDDGWIYRLIDMYRDTGDREQDYITAYNYYFESAEKDDCEIKCNLGVMYKKGKGVKRDYQKALYWFTKASEQGCERAKFHIGLMYEYGEGVKKNYLKALDYFMDSGVYSEHIKNIIEIYKTEAEVGDGELQYKLGLIYENGIGIRKNSKNAIYWYEKAASNGIRDANNRLKKCKESNNFTSISNIATVNNNSREEKKAEIKENKISEIFINDITSPKLPEERYIKNCKTSASTFYHLGQMYYYGDYIPQDYCKAFRCYAKATELGNRYAQKNLSIMYYYGEGVEKDYSKAFKLYHEYIETSPEFKLLNSIFGNRKTENNQELKKAVEDNDLKEQIDKQRTQDIGKYFFDKQRTQDYKKAIEWYLKSAEQGDESAQNMVRQIYFKLQDYDNLLKWCKKGIEQNQTNAKYTMGLIFLKGYGVEKNILKAKEWYEKAAEDNDALTQYQLGRLYFDKMNCKMIINRHSTGLRKLQKTNISQL